MARRVLTIRTDAIGDAILWGGALERVRTRFPDARHAVLCREAVAPLYEHCPFVDDIIPIRYDDAVFSDDDRAEAVRAANAWQPDLLLDPIRSKARNAIGIIRGIDAPRSLVLEPDDANLGSAEAIDAHRNAELIPAARSVDGAVSELLQHRAFLAGLGDHRVEIPQPTVWCSESDRIEAGAMLSTGGLEPEQTLVLAPRGRWSYKMYPAWDRAIALAIDLGAEVRSIVVIGGPDARLDAEAIRAAVPSTIPLLDLSGRTTIRHAIALVGLCRVCAGTDTFAIHAACAQGVPNAVLLGGGHPGRFLPYSPLTRVAMLPLDCYGCDWRCAHERAHCVAAISPETVARAIAAAASGRTPTRPLVFISNPPPTELGNAVQISIDRAAPGLGVDLAAGSSRTGGQDADTSLSVDPRRVGPCDCP